MIFVDQIVKKFLSEKRTQTNLARMDASIGVLMDYSS